VIRVLLVDDQELVRGGFRMILEARDGFLVVGEAGNGVEAVARARSLAPDVVVMDIRMPTLDGIEATARIVAATPRVRVLILTTFDADEHVYAAIRAGASGFLLKDARPDELAAAVRTVAAGDAVIAPSATRRLIERFAALEADVHPPSPAVSELSEREVEILALLASGRSNAELAQELFLAETTIKTHISNILRKLGVRDRVQAVIAAYDAGLVRPRR